MAVIRPTWQLDAPSREPVSLGRTFLPKTEVCSVVQDDSRSSQILQGLYKMFKAEQFCDITFVTNKKRKLKAHRVVLTTLSPYFEALLGSNWQEKQQDAEVGLEWIDETVFTNLVEFAYTGRIEITPENVQDVLHGANFFGVEFIQKSCVNLLKASLDPIACVGILQLAERYAMQDLRSAAKKYCVEHFGKVSQEEEFLELPLLLLLEILQEDQLCVIYNGIVPTMAEQEQFVLQAVFRYIKHDLENRRVRLADLLACVRLPFLSLPSLQALQSHELVKNCKKSLEVVDRAIIALNACDTSHQIVPRKLDDRIWKGSIHGHSQPQRQPWKEIEIFDDEKILPAANNEVFVRGMKIWIIRLGDKSVVGGMKVFYSNGLEVMHGYSGEGANKQYDFVIDEDERITQVYVYTNHLFIYGLLFYTNKQESDGSKRCYGPYGACSGWECCCYIEVPPGTYSYLAWVTGAVMQAPFRNRTCPEMITRLQFVWRTFWLESIPPPIPPRLRPRTLSRPHLPVKTP